MSQQELSEGYNGYLRPHLTTILAMADRGSSAGVIAKHLWNLGARPHPSVTFFQVEAIAAMVRHILRRYGRGSLRAAPRHRDFDGQKLTQRAFSVLANEDLTTWQQVAFKTDAELLCCPNLGELTLAEIREAQTRAGFRTMTIHAERYQYEYRERMQHEQDEYRERLVRKDVEKQRAWAQVCDFMLRGMRPPPECLVPNREAVKAKMLEIGQMPSVADTWRKKHLSEVIGVSEEEIEAATLELWLEGKVNNPPR